MMVIHHNSLSFSVAGTSIILGLSIIRAERSPFSTIPTIQAMKQQKKTKNLTIAI